MVLKMPCAPLCEHGRIDIPLMELRKGWVNPWIAERKLDRPHLHCVTCPRRRWWYTKKGKQKFVYIPQGQQFMMTKAFEPTVLPWNYTPYVIFINRECRWFWLKKLLLKPFLSIAEVIANW